LGRYVRLEGRARWRGLAPSVALAVLAPLLSGCGVLGGLTDTNVRSLLPMTVTSPAFSVDVPMPAQYTCRGAKVVSPPLSWSGAPSAQVKSFAIVADDAQAPITPYIYWIVYDIGPTTSDIPQGRLPTGARQAMNSSGTIGYDPPCPAGPPGSSHRYRFTVYALDARLNPHMTGLRATWSAIARHVIVAGRLTTCQFVAIRTHTACRAA
jgi:Raf kinase inhibitor-like YbhB/YbcL family protein